MEAKHTELPWQNSGTPSVIDASGKLVAAIYGDHPECKVDERMIANTEFIVRACNAHDDLVRALQAVERKLRELRTNGAEQLTDTIEQIDAALAKAGAA